MRFSDAWLKRFSICLLFLYAFFIAWQSLTPGGETAPFFPHDDKVMHFTAYFLFALLSFPLLTTVSANYWLIGSIIVFGALMELGQSFVPLREPSFWDFLANSAGALFGLLAVTKLKRHPRFLFIASS